MKDFTRSAAHDGVHDSIEFNEYRSAEFWTEFWARRVRREYILEKLAPYLIVLGTVVAFIVIGYIDGAL